MCHFNHGWGLLPGRSLFIGSFFVFAALVFADTPEVETSEQEAPLEIDSMDTEGLDPKLARVLNSYYGKTFTSEEHWRNVESVVFDGTLHLPEQSLRFTAYKKKPDYCKLVIYGPRGGRIVLSYDGEKAWQYNSASTGAEVSAMPVAEAQNFIRDAKISGHLLSPLAKEKKISLLDVVKVDGHTCYELKVVLPDGQVVRSALDVITYAERRQVTVNNVNGLEEHNIYDDFRIVDGVRFPFASRMLSGGKEAYRVEMNRVRLNTGLTSFMFQESSELALPSVQSKSFTADEFEPAQPTGTSFGEAPFGSTLFPEQNQPEAGPFSEVSSE